MPIMLPIIMYHNKKWFRDDRLQQIRQVKNPHSFIDFYKVEWNETKQVPYLDLNINQTRFND